MALDRDEPPRRGILQVLYSPHDRFRKVVFEPGETKTIGRDERAGVCVRDPSLSGEHLSASFDGVGFQLRQCLRAGGRARMLFEGAWTRHGEAMNGSVVTIGDTTLRFFLERGSAQVHEAPLPGAENVRRILDEALVASELYGVFDAARDPRILTLLDEAIDQHASLYEGAKAAMFDHYAPHLVRFDPESRLIDRVLSEGWGASWAIFARSSRGPKEVRRHFRRFLMVTNDVDEQRMYFRYYDPRVLSEMMTIATERQKSSLLDALDGLYCEDPSGELLRFEPTVDAERQIRA